MDRININKINFLGNKIIIENDILHIKESRGSKKQIFIKNIKQLTFNPPVIYSELHYGTLHIQVEVCVKNIMVEKYDYPVYISRVHSKKLDHLITYFKIFYPHVNYVDLSC
mgnify:CR=1 FL=1